MTYVLWYLLLAIPCFVMAQCFGYRINRGLCFRHALVRLWRDYRYLHCPWSWEVARKERLSEMRIFLGPDGRYHDRLGHITEEDCERPLRCEEIARHAYVSRAVFWRRGVFGLVFAPFQLLLIAVLFGFQILSETD